MVHRRLKEQFQELDPVVARVILRVFQAENAKLSSQKPRGIMSEIELIIEEEVRNYET